MTPIESTFVIFGPIACIITLVACGIFCAGKKSQEEIPINNTQSPA
jgi:hypothetical protein